MRLCRLLNRSGDGRNSRLVKDQFDIFERTLQVGRIRDVTFNKIDIVADFVDVLNVASREIINYSHAHALLYERVSDMRPDKTSSSSDEGNTRKSHLSSYPHVFKAHPPDVGRRIDISQISNSGNSHQFTHTIH